jgi:hypothetical protein
VRGDGEVELGTGDGRYRRTTSDFLSSLIYNSFGSKIADEVEMDAARESEHINNDESVNQIRP